jgi:glycerol-3-phosphate acyltransferase PlsY
VTGQLSGVLAVLAAFLCGAVPWGYLIARYRGGIDLRTVGSGGTGATNVLRTLGKSASAAVLVLDFLKGLIPVVVAGWLGLAEWWVGAVAVAAVAGHCWSPFIGFKGGKGMATGAGAATALLPQVLIVAPLMALVVWKTRYVSLGSLVAAVAAGVLAVVLAASGRANWSSAVAILAIVAIIVLRHAANIERLTQGTERRIGEMVAIK